MSSNLIVCLSETSKKLREVGWDKETVFVWMKLHKYSQLEIWPLDALSNPFNPKYYTESYFAPTSAEIGLPEYLEKDYMGQRVRANLLIRQFDGEWHINYMVPVLEEVGAKFVNFELFEHCRALTEVEAKAKMWIYLKSKGLI